MAIIFILTLFHREGTIRIIYWFNFLFPYFLAPIYALGSQLTYVSFLAKLDVDSESKAIVVHFQAQS
jgi:predicted ferric reductase